MPLPQKPPGRGAQNRRVHFPFACTPRGASWEAHIAGPCHWYDCHCIGKSKPCLSEMTGGELCCDRDHNIDEPKTIGYQPLYAASNGKPCFVIVYDYARDAIDKLKVHHLVSITRGKSKSDTVAIEYTKLNAPLYHSTRADLMRPADLSESLLRIWKIPELTMWYYQTHGIKSDNAVSQPKKVSAATVSPDTPPPTKVPFPAGELAGLMDDLQARALARAEQAERNAKWLREHTHAKNGNGKPK